ncbi:hypothetical protein BZA05DRAFT_401056 [Tricharina praecox]|uniref:uncharacterized protein n=1 Tax=Tricharina praecox TaxID=43433 RepID=UPI00221FD3CF|nr:uncharacterized protein BZA05DRAFT_401056 [Tricharina praecox]KAI5850140.1 hypothetical protein BZA05DRAFT_401056 [Tricharina praecox]
MGLAGPKASTKISKDPRNTFWSKDTSRFGHQYLANLGWVPGQNLGDTTSSYHASGHITDASSTGIKIVLKDDTLGIGAKKGAQHDECTGLLGLQGLLGRLNGDDKVVEQVKLEEDRKKNEWIQSKWGMRFVRGEVWVADDLTKLRERMVKEKEEKAEALKAKAEKKDGKNSDDKDSGEEASRKKRKRDSDDVEKDKKQSKKSKSKDGKKKSKRRGLEEDGTETPATTDRESKSRSVSGDETESKEERKSRRKEEKRLKKERKEKRDARRKEKKDREEKKKKKKKASSDGDSSSESETEAASGSVTPASAMNGRHALRHRFIAAKRSAMMDATSLNEILMIKA